MKTLLLGLIIILTNCQQAAKPSGEAKQDPPVSDTSALKSMKGWELYSWLDNEWKFVLVPGTNRNKTLNEILSGREVNNVNELEMKILMLREKETVIWMDGLREPILPGQRIHFQKPPDDIINRILEVCKKKNIELANINR